MSSSSRNSYKESEGDKPAYPTGTSVADIILDPKSYSALVHSAEGSSSERVPQSSSEAEARNDHSQQGPSPSTSISDLVLNNVTYDAILASSSKSLRLNPNDQGPADSPVGDDARTPPNSPSLAEPPQGFGSLLGATVQVMSSNEGKR